MEFTNVTERNELETCMTSVLSFCAFKIQKQRAQHTEEVRRCDGTWQQPHSYHVSRVHKELLSKSRTTSLYSTTFLTWELS